MTSRASVHMCQRFGKEVLPAFLPEVTKENNSNDFGLFNNTFNDVSTFLECDVLQFGIRVTEIQCSLLSL